MNQGRLGRSTTKAMPVAVGTASVRARKWWGVDGCRAGWIAVGLTAGNGWQARLVHTASELLDLPGAMLPALIDIPIGLTGKGDGSRGCDRAARKLLGFPRSTSVFPAPSRACLRAKDYKTACRLNQEATGHKISRQAWGISGKIREIDKLLRAADRRTPPLRESHPEVCFMALNGGRAMSMNKKTHGGRAERIAVLESCLPGAADVVTEIAHAWPRKIMARDDIVDALVLAVTARHGKRALVTLPDVPARDAHGLPMEIVYASL